MENLVQIVGLLPVVLIVGVVVIFMRHGKGQENAAKGASMATAEHTEHDPDT
jgi:hypothetical protein